MQRESIIQTAIAILAVLIGYPNLGSTMILLMTPLVIYMVFRRDAAFLPALMIHCTSDTSIMYAVLFSMMIVCFIKSKQLYQNIITRWFLICLIVSLPIYLVLTVQRFRLDGDTWQLALAYSSYYLSFWAFLYYYIVSNTFNRKTARMTIVSLLVFVVLCILSGQFLIKLLFLIIIVGLINGFLMALKYQKKVLGIIILGVSGLLFVVFSSGLTFSIFFSLVYSMLIAYLSFNQQGGALKALTGIIPYIAIAILMVWGVNSYTTANYGAYSETIDFSDWDGFLNRIQFKLFDDRAPFWEAGWEQLMLYTPVFPMHNIPNFTAYIPNGHIIEDVAFGAHNTPLQLFRIFGFLMGGLLVICYIISTYSASRILCIRKVDPFSVSLFSVSIGYSIVVFLTGTASMLPDMALFTFGLLGVAHGNNISKTKL